MVKVPHHDAAWWARNWRKATPADFHPLADAFPLIEGDEFEQFCARMTARGFRKSRPIVIHDGSILDGRNRWRAACATQLQPAFVDYDPKAHGTAVEFVISENIDRRHLNERQRAIAAAALETLRQGVRAEGTVPTRADLASAMQVAERSVTNAAVLRDHGSDALRKLAAAGGLSLTAAANVAGGLGKREQDRLVKQGEKAILDAARKIRARQNEARRAERNAHIIVNSDVTAQSMVAGGRRFPLIYADPPWRYIMGDTDRSVDNHYGTMSLADICALPVRQLAMPDSVLAMWIPEPHLFCSGVPVLQAWDFLHKSGLVWDKELIGMGHYFRVQHEHLLLCTRGAVPEPLPANRPRSLLRKRRTPVHSEKPNADVQALLEQMYPQFFRPGEAPLAIELFARALKPDEKPRPGWAVWGNQAPRAQGAAA